MKYIFTVLILASFLLTACTGDAIKAVDDTQELQKPTKTRDPVVIPTEPTEPSSGGGGGGVVNQTLTGYVSAHMSKREYLNDNEEVMEIYLFGSMRSLGPTQIFHYAYCNFDGGKLSASSALVTYLRYEDVYGAYLTADYAGSSINGKEVYCSYSGQEADNYDNSFYDYRRLNEEQMTFIDIKDAMLLTEALTGQNLVYVNLDNEVGGIEEIYITVRVEREEGDPLYYTSQIEYQPGDYPTSVAHFENMDYNLTDATYVSLRVEAYTENNLDTVAYRWYTVGQRSSISLIKDGADTLFRTNLVDVSDTSALIQGLEEELRTEVQAEAMR